MAYTYPEALNAMEKIAVDLLRKVFPGRHILVRIIADSYTGTASVTWDMGHYLRVTILMPVRPATYRMSQDEFDYWAAYTLHEIGHPAHTDKAVWDAAVARNAHRLLNFLEDVREEKATIDLGLAVNAVRVFSRLIDMLHVKAVADGYDPNNVASIGWTLATLGRHANGYAVDVSDITRRLDPNGVVGRIVAWALPALAACGSTQDCLDLADRVIGAINASSQKAPQEAADEREQEKASGDRLDPENAPAGPVEAVEGEFSDKDVEEVDLRPNERDNMSSYSRDAATQGQLIDILRNVEKAKPREQEVTGRNRHGVVETVAENASRMGVQRALLARALKAEDVDSFDTGRSHGRLDMRSLAKVAQDNPYVFGRRIVTEGYDTDVQVLVDGSSSMAGANMQAASTLALVVAQAASRVGVDCFVHMFSDAGLHVATEGKHRPDARKFGYMVVKPAGSTPLTESMLQVAKMQKARAWGKRKVLFVVTDGACNSGPAIAKAAGEYIERVLGVEIANLHIGRRKPGMFRNEVAVDPSNVNEAGLRQFTALLERGI